MKTRTLIASLAVIALFLAIGVPAIMAISGMELASVASDGTQGNADSSREDWPSISADGRFVAFSSGSSNLVSGDTNGAPDIFVRDRQSGTTTRVSVATGGTEAEAMSSHPSINADGRYIAFSSIATNLVTPATSSEQIFVRDRQAGTTTLVSENSSGDMADFPCYSPSISANGLYIAFASLADNLVNDDTNMMRDIFVRDLLSGSTTRVSVASDGMEANDESEYPDISHDGRYVAFASAASNLVAPATSLVQIFVRDRQAGTTVLVSENSTHHMADDICMSPSISGDGRYVAFTSSASNLVSGDANGKYDIFVRDLEAETTTRVSVASDGSEANGDSGYPDVSYDGSCVAFVSTATNLVSGDSNGCMDVFVRNLQSSTTTIASINPDGTQANDHSKYPAISAGGYYVAFPSGATNLMAGDSNIQWDVFVASLVSSPPAVVSVNPSGGSQGQCPVTVVITGSNLSGATSVSFGTGITVSSFTVNSARQVTATVCIGAGAAPGAYTVAVVTPGGTSTLAGGFTVVQQNQPVGAGAAPSHGSSMTGATTTVQTVGIPNIQPQSAGLSATRVAAGTPVSVTADMVNTGTGNGTSVVRLYVNGEQEAQQGVTVSSGGTARVSFDVTRNEPGTYSVYVGGVQAGSFVVDQSTPDTILIISGALLSLSFILGIIYITRRKAI